MGKDSHSRGVLLPRANIDRASAFLQPQTRIASVLGLSPALSGSECRESERPEVAS